MSDRIDLENEITAAQGHLDGLLEKRRRRDAVAYSLATVLVGSLMEPTSELNHCLVRVYRYTGKPENNITLKAEYDPGSKQPVFNFTLWNLNDEQARSVLEALQICPAPIIPQDHDSKN